MHYEALTKKGESVFDILKRLELLSSFSLAGGTGLALQIGHRVSVDFDFFSQKKLDDDLLKRLEKELPNESIKVIRNDLGELTVLINGVKVTFLHYPFPTITPTVNLEKIRAYSVKEIAASKAYTIGRRGEYKDYVDLYFLFKKDYITLSEVISLSEKKYGDKFNGRLFLEQLLFKEDIQEMEVKFLKEEISEKEIFSYFEKIVSEFKIK